MKLFAITVIFAIVAVLVMVEGYRWGPHGPGRHQPGHGGPPSPPPQQPINATEIWNHLRELITAAIKDAIAESGSGSNSTSNAGSSNSSSSGSSSSNSTDGSSSNSTSGN
ncbi:bromodomain testis-specific protein-like [Culex pipiens pallens]|uniref:bromodomain testis-specific protein-like n=1 Tax=Culex pipiens pallens TaxID=42434 RepID=UPI00195444A7|nr:bromodomain testis-specific protein-like [Culex pipiens pallens]